MSIPILLHHTFEHTAQRRPDKCALITREGRFAYGQLWRDAANMAAFLQHRGVRRGDRVAILLDNTAEAVVAIYGVLMAGAVFMPINPLTKQEKLGYMLRDAAPAAFISHGHFASVFSPALADAGSVHTRIFAGHMDSGCSWQQAVSFSADVQDPGLIDQDLAAIIYTSGSTGDAKGVMLSHRNMLSAQMSVSTYLGLREDDKILCALPLAFDYGLYQILMAFKLGACVVLERSFAFPAKALETMAAEEVTVFPGVPTMFAMLANIDISRYPLNRLRMITNTAAALSEQHIRDVRRLFPHATLFSMYGLTECKRVTYLPPEQLDTRPLSVGRGMPNQEIYLIDEGGNRLPNGSVGQLVIRGSHVMRGYWRKPDETAERLRPGPMPGERVLYSGDIFRTDDEGYFYFVGRADDIIKSRGEKVSPKEVENALYGLDGVLEAAVIGVPDPLLGEAIKAYVVLKPGYTYTDKDVIRHCLAHLENFMAPKFVSFVSELPKTDTGKIRKTGLT